MNIRSWSQWQVLVNMCHNFWQTEQNLMSSCNWFFFAEIMCQQFCHFSGELMKLVKVNVTHFIIEYNLMPHWRQLLITLKMNVKCMFTLMFLKTSTFLKVIISESFNSHTVMRKKNVFLSWSSLSHVYIMKVFLHCHYFLQQVLIKIDSKYKISFFCPFSFPPDYL